ncbi:MAG: hypothetical protein JXD19_08295 [Deltaproteobacteria bacterium]|nr:hypothetical protein [Deltaproteobacteria bacterium]
MEENGFTSPIVFSIKAFTGKLYAVKALGRFGYSGYPNSLAMMQGSFFAGGIKRL